MTQSSELSLVNSESTSNKQINYNKVDSPLTTHKRQLSWIIASLGQVAHFTSVVIRNVLATSGWVRFAHTAPYAKSAHNSLVKAIAFTLAETLVVMGIIGVVAALTIPNLNQSTGDREKVAKVKKIYSNLEDAFGRATAVYGPFSEWISNLSYESESDLKIIRERVAERLVDFLKVSKTCKYVEGCADLGEFSSSVNYDEVYSFILADGTSLAFFNGSDIIVDIDGLKGSNKFGKDQFLFSIDDTKHDLKPTWMASYEYCYSQTPKANGGFERDCGSYWVITNSNMDYLKTDSQGKCPNGTTLDWTTNTSCK